MLEKYLSIFGITLDEFLTIAFDETNKIILITKKDMSRVKFVNMESEVWKLLRSHLPEELQFIGFQHAEEGNVFSAYATML